MSIVEGRRSALAELDDAGMPAMLVDRNGFILDANQAAATICARSPEQLRGTPLSSCAVEADQVIDALISEALVQGVSHAALTVHSFPGRTSPLPVTAVRVAPEPEPDGAPAAVRVVFTESEPTPHLATKLPPARADARLRAAQKVAGVGVWEWDPETDELIVSDAFRELIGASPDIALTLTDALRAMHGDDRVLVQQRVDEALQGNRRPSASSTVSALPTAQPAGYRPNAKWCKDEHDGGIRVVGATRDVTAQVAAGQELRRAENFWHAAIDSLSAHVAIVDEHGDIIAVNKAWRRFGEQRGAASDCLGVNYFDACGSADDPYARQATDGLRQVLAGDRDEFTLEYPCPAPDQLQWFVMRVTPYETSARRWAVVAHEDATARRSERAQVLLQAALLDEVDVSVHATDIDRHIVSWNEGASACSGGLRRRRSDRRSTSFWFRRPRRFPRRSARPQSRKGGRVSSP